MQSIFIISALFLSAIMQLCQAKYSSQCKGSCKDLPSTLYCPIGSFVTDLETSNGKYGSTWVIVNLRIFCRNAKGEQTMNTWAFSWPRSTLESNPTSNVNEQIGGIKSLTIWGGSLVNSIRVGSSMLGGLGGSATPWPSPSGAGKGLKLKGFICHYKTGNDVVTGTKIQYLTGLQAITV